MLENMPNKTLQVRILPQAASSEFPAQRTRQIHFYPHFIIEFLLHHNQAPYLTVFIHIEHPARRIVTQCNIYRNTGCCLYGIYRISRMDKNRPDG